MHELGIMAEVARIAKKTAYEHNMKKVETIILQVGELTSIVPQYAKEFFPAVTYKTPLENTKLEIEIVPGNAKCRNCKTEFNVVKNEGKCPECHDNNFDVISGTELVIKEIVAS